MEVDWPAQRLLFPPALATSAGATVTRTASLALHDSASVTTTVNSVLSAGVTSGWAALALLRQLPSSQAGVALQA
jgi:hypothetical protein